MCPDQIQENRSQEDVQSKGFHYAGFWVRAIADLIDSALLDFLAVVVCFVFLGVYYWINVLLAMRSSVPEPAFFESLNPFVLQIILVALRSALALFYFTWATYRYETTLGKRCFRIYVLSTRTNQSLTIKQSLIRCLSYLISYLPLGAGFLMAAFHPEKRALHDLISHSICIRRGKVH